jgi:RNA polymerase sigma factor (sigma-70 family)
MADVTRILAQIESGDPAAADQLLPLVYNELRKLAAAKLAQEKPGQTLQATALVHEAYLRLVGPVGNTLRGVPSADANNEILAPGSRPLAPSFDSRGHFFSAAAEAMRRILIERARQKQSLKRGGDYDRIALADVEPAFLPLACDDLLGLDDALRKLQQLHPRKAAITNLRFFAGLTTAEAAQAVGVSLATAENDWAYARSWLKLEIEGRAAAK